MKTPKCQCNPGCTSDDTRRLVVLHPHFEFANNGYRPETLHQAIARGGFYTLTICPDHVNPRQWEMCGWLREDKHIDWIDVEYDFDAPDPEEAGLAWNDDYVDGYSELIAETKGELAEVRAAKLLALVQSAVRHGCSTVSPRTYRAFYTYWTHRFHKQL
jgi:hypothetical protein